MLTNSNKQQKGFTIIEVLIVLAIAGLILLIVFLAVPALNRQSRNSQRASDAGAIAAAYNEYVNNNGGTPPTSNANFHANVVPNFKTGFYDSADNTKVVFVPHAAASSPAGPANGVIDRIEVHSFTKCSGNTATAVGATRRNAAVLYRIESGGTNGMIICRDI